MTVAEQAPAAAAPQTSGIQLGTVFTLGGISDGRVLSLAAAAAPLGSRDPVDTALEAGLASRYPELEPLLAQPCEVTPPGAGRLHSVTRLRDVATGSQPDEDVVVLRGELHSVLSQCKAGYQVKSLAKRNANYVLRRGFRPLAVASAPLGADGEPGTFTLNGFVAIRPAGKRKVSTPDSAPNEWVRMNVWSASLRFQHWLNVAMIFILSCTGYFILDPFFGPQAGTSDQSQFLMGWVRFIHFTAAFCWLVIGLTRVVVSFTSRDRYLRWPTLWPFKHKEDWRNFGRVLLHYIFVKRDGPLYLAHNPFQQLAYTLVYVACAIQMVAGFSLFALYHMDNPFWVLVSTPTTWFGIQAVRMLHTCMMFAIWAFVIMHVYLAVRAESLERHGGISAMINGGVWVRRGSQPVDAPTIE